LRISTGLVPLLIIRPVVSLPGLLVGDSRLVSILISRVFNDLLATVRKNDAVHSLGIVTVAVFLVSEIVAVVVLHLVLEVVLGRFLEK
jgi:hypothetical protein